MHKSRFTSPNFLMRSSICALLLIAGLSVAHFFLVSSLTDSRAADSNTINLAGRQRLLCQKIINLTLVALETEDQNFRTRVALEVMEALETLEKTQGQFMAGSQEKGFLQIGEASSEVADSNPAASLRDMKEQVLRLIQPVLTPAAGRAVDSRAFRNLLEAAERYLNQMDVRVAEFERNAQGKLRSFQNMELGFLFSVIALLVLELVFFFRPMARGISSAHDSLRQAHDQLREDVAKITKAEKAARQSEAFMNEILTNTPEGVITMDENGHITLINPAAEAIFGYTNQEAVGKNANTLIIPPEFRKKHHQALEQFIKTEDGPFLGKRFETAALRKNGAQITIEMVVSAVKFDNRYFFTSFLRDISERKEAEKTLRRFKTTLDMTRDSIFMFDPDTLRFIYVNQGAAEQVGFSRAELLEMSPLDIEPLFDEKSFRSVIAPLQHGESDSITFETLHRRKDGGDIPVEVFLQHVVLEEEQDRFVAIVRDISERKRAEEELARLSEGLEHVVESIVITDPEGAIQYVNPAFEQNSGFSRAEVLGRNAGVVNSGKQAPSFYKNLWSTISRGEIWKGIFINQRKDGTFFEEEATIAPVFDRSKKIINYIAVKRDVTEVRKTEARLRQSQKMEAIGVLSGGIAHDFNNILTPILGYSDLAKMTLPEDHDVQRHLDAIKKAGKRARDLVSQILVFSRQTKGVRKPLRLDLLVKEVLKLIRAALPNTIEIRNEMGKKQGLVSADVTQLHSVLMNLCTNASHAMPNGGVLTVGLHTLQLTEHELAGGKKITGEFVRLRVGDTGTGMEKETLSRIFEPFYTTKPVGSGTGLGLSTVFGIVEQHEGYISVESQIGRGSIFDLFLPVGEPESRDLEVEPFSPRLAGRESLLVVDDEVEILAMIQEGLRALGYRVTTRHQPAAALRFFREHREALDLVITDRTMPGMTGEHLIKQLRRMRPGIPTILCTGNTEKLNEEQITKLKINAVVEKPYAPGLLAAEIRRIFDTAQSPSGGNRAPSGERMGGARIAQGAKISSQQDAKRE